MNALCLSFPICEMGVAADESTHLTGWLPGLIYIKCLEEYPGHSRCQMSVSHCHYYCFIYHMGERVTGSDVIVVGGENEKQLWPQNKAGLLSTRGQSQLLEFQSSSRPHHTPAWALVPGGLADLRPPARSLGARFPRTDASSKLCGEKPPLGRCTPTVTRHFWQRLFQSHPGN